MSLILFTVCNGKEKKKLSTLGSLHPHVFWGGNLEPPPPTNIKNPPPDVFEISA